MTKLHSTAQAAHSLRCIAALSHRATFIATLAAASVVFAQSTTAPAVAPPIAQVTPTDGQDVGETFTVQFQDTDILQALQMLSMQGRRNIIASKGVSGTLSANLFDVTLAEALDVLLRANDFRMEESGNFIYIFSYLRVNGGMNGFRRNIFRFYRLYIWSWYCLCAHIIPLLFISSIGYVYTNSIYYTRPLIL